MRDRCVACGSSAARQCPADRPCWPSEGSPLTYRTASRFFLCSIRHARTYLNRTLARGMLYKGAPRYCFDITKRCWRLMHMTQHELCHPAISPHTGYNDERDWCNLREPPVAANPSYKQCSSSSLYLVGAAAVLYTAGVLIKTDC